MAPKEKKPVCFVVSPIGEDGSPERIHADWLLEGIIRPVFKDHFPQYDIVRADKMAAPGLIDTQIIEHLLDAELVIADITTLNPNVFYEIGIRHVSGGPVVHMVRAGDPIPFDLKIFRHIPFIVSTHQGLENAKVSLKQSLDAVHSEDFKLDNPVTRTRAQVEFEKKATASEKVLLDQISDLSSRLAALEGRKRKYDVIAAGESRIYHSFADVDFAGRTPKTSITITIKHPMGLSEEYSEIVDGAMASHFSLYEVAHGSTESVYSVAPTTANYVAAEAVTSYLAQHAIGAEIVVPFTLKKKPL
ncbi:hypothetical protein [Rhizobium sp. Rhizsp82]|uniref:hypothetical protein n=1 Tax=Rhizobium sp. Rhizsp82 TaxID=3243057 RepID=UPI0039B6589C